MSNYTLDWRADEVILALEGATREGLLALAYQLEGEIKVGATPSVDTGFMRNSTYVHSSEASSFQAQSKVLKSNKTGQKSLHQTVNAPPPADDETVYVGVAADYAIYRESVDPFVYPALQRVARTAGATVAGAIREVTG